MDINTLQPIQPQSIKQLTIARLETLILSGELKTGQRLPAERDMAARLNISRPVLHEALVDLAARGLVRIAPRHGVTVNDYRTNGSVALLESLLSYHQGSLDPEMLRSLMAMRVLIETETARLAALQPEAARQPHLAALEALLQRELDSDCTDVAALTELDFQFHLQVALASGNLIYPLIVNSFKSVYTSLTGAFFTHYQGTPVIEQVLDFHHHLVQAIRQGDSETAAQVMRAMLQQGEALFPADAQSAYRADAQSAYRADDW